MITIDDIIVPPPEEGVIVHPITWFDSPGDVELEIGCGKGGFLLDRARHHPEKRFVGIEWANRFFRHAADRMARWHIANVRIMRADAADFVTNHLGPACLTALHVYHPDPWPKRRHHKRRLIQPRFVETAVRVMAPNARWAIQTDHDEYFEHIRRVVLGNPALVEVPFDDPAIGVEGEAIKTNYAIKYLDKGRAIHRLAVVKVT